MTEDPITSLPYLLEQRGDEKHVIINRRRKPLGSRDAAWADYDRAPGYAMTITPEAAASISSTGDSETRAVYLYVGGCEPWTSDANWAAYKDRIEALSKLCCDELREVLQNAVRPGRRAYCHKASE